jgi:hypothetical protein
MDNHAIAGAVALGAFLVARVLGAYWWPADRTVRARFCSQPCVVAGAVSGSLSLSCFVWLLHRLFFLKREFSIGSEFFVGPSPTELLTWAGVALAGGALGFCIQAFRSESKTLAGATTLVAANAITVWALFLVALWGRLP